MNVVARGLQIHHLQIVARTTADEHWLVGSQEKGLVLQFISLVHATDHLADSAAEMRAHQFELRESFEDTPHDPLPRGDRIETESPGAGMMRPLTKAPMENSDAVQTRGHGVRHRTPALAEPTFLEPVQLIKGLAF
jgi:hypothetical protein